MTGATPYTCPAVVPGGRASRSGGLTLLEVLAAFLIFSMVFTVLVGTSQRGVKSQGVSARRLTANEIADRELAELETTLQNRTLPGIPEDEIEDEPFTIRIATGPLGAEAAPLASPSDSFTDALLSSGGESLATLTEQLPPEIAKHLRRYDIEVEWEEGAGKRSVRRTTFAFDWVGAVTENAALFSQGGADGLSALAATALTGSGASGAGSDPTGAGEAGRAADGPGGDAGRSSSGSDFPELFKEFCRQKGAQAPEICGGQ